MLAMTRPAWPTPEAWEEIRALIPVENRPRLEVLGHLTAPIKADWECGERLQVFDSVGLAQAVARLAASSSTGSGESSGVR